MKRELLFKAKREDGKGWVQGFPMYDMESSKWIMVATIHYSGDGMENPPCDHQQSFIVIPETICQFTGLIDKQGSRIFEGDQITISIEFPFSPEKNHKENVVVVWQEFRSLFAVSFSNDGREFPNNDLYRYVHNIKEKPLILGNIHD